MIYAEFKKAIDSLVNEKEEQNRETLISKIVHLIDEGQINASRIEFELVKKLGERRILAKLWCVDKANLIPLNLWMKWKDLENAAAQGQLENVITLLEDDELKEIAARNENQVLRSAAKGNHQDMVYFLLNIPAINAYFTSIERYDAEAIDRDIFLNQIQSAVQAKKSGKTDSRNDYIKIAFNKLCSGNLSNLDHKYFLLVLNAANSAINPEYVSIVSYLCVLPSIRLKATEDKNFRKILSDTKAWLSSIKSEQRQLKKTLPQTPEHVGTYKVKLGVNPFNLLAYQQFLVEKVKEEERKKYYPEEFVSKEEQPMDSFTIEGGKLKYNGKIESIKINTRFK